MKPHDDLNIYVEPDELSEQFDSVMARLRRKGGRIHMSLSKGVIAYIHGENPIVIVKGRDK